MRTPGRRAKRNADAGDRGTDIGSFEREAERPRPNAWCNDDHHIDLRMLF